MKPSLSLAAAMGAFAVTAAVANAAIILDNSDSVFANNTSPITIEGFTIGDNSNRLLAVTVGTELAGAGQAFTLTFNGVPLTQTVSEVGGTGRDSYLYTLANPDAVTADIVLTWTTVAAGREDAQISAVSLYGDNALSVASAQSGAADESALFDNIDQSTDAFYYFGVNVDNGTIPVTSYTAFGALSGPSKVDYNSANNLDSHTSLARGYYFASGTGIDLSIADDESFSRIAVVEAVPEPTTTALLGLGGLALILRRRK